MVCKLLSENILEIWKTSKHGFSQLNWYMLWLQKFWADWHMGYKVAYKSLDYENFKLEDGSFDISL